MTQRCAGIAEALIEEMGKRVSTSCFPPERFPLSDFPNIEYGADAASCICVVAFLVKALRLSLSTRLVYVTCDCRALK